MFSALSAFVRSRKLLPRLVFGAIGALAAITIVKVVEARADNLDRILAEVPSSLFEVVRTDFPVEYAAFAEDLKQLIKRGGDIKQATYEHLLAIRLEYAPNLGQAEDLLLAEVSDSTVDVYRAVLKRHGPELCAQFATIGMPALAHTDFEAVHAELVLDQVAAMLHASRSGFDKPVNRPLASDADWQAVAAESLKFGADMDSFLAMANGEPVLGVCPSVIGFLTAATNLEKTSGGLVRAELLAMLAGQV